MYVRARDAVCGTRVVALSGYTVPLAFSWMVQMNKVLEGLGSSGLSGVSH
jgi:hypothetical protein